MKIKLWKSCFSINACVWFYVIYEIFLTKGWMSQLIFSWITHEKKYNELVINGQYGQKAYTRLTVCFKWFD